MRLIAQNYRTGALDVVDAPEPAARPGGVLVRTLFSLISTGTELMKVNEAQLSLVGKARARPDQVRKLRDAVAQQGPVATYKKAMNRLDSYTPLGYSCVGVVVRSGPGAEEFREGDLVACAGNEHALHAEVNWVPRNLCVAVPDGVDPAHAAFTTVGAIAMQGLRQGEVQLGETACVVGLGLIGQLLVRLLVASGVRVVGLDPVADRRQLALDAGAVLCGDPQGAAGTAFEGQVAELTRGLGVDHVFLVAGGSSNEPVEMAARIARDRGRVVDIGKVRLDLPWNAYYEKELEVRFSRSYGPGRYDDRYELDGVDYPPGYVRWTERRNMECFLDLLASGAVDVGPLVSGTFPLEEAPEVYRRLKDGELPGVGYLFGYGEGELSDLAPEPVAQLRAVPAATTHTGRPAIGSRAVRVGFIGAGNYATSMLLPHLAAAEDVSLTRVATTRSLSAVNVGRKFGFEQVSTDSDDVLDDDNLDVIAIATRHHSHADFVCRALRTGKAVYVEKPLALDEKQVATILDTVEETGNDRLMVGFNRRFAPLYRQLAEGMGAPTTSSVVRYLVNAGSLAAGSWYLDEQREGTRFAGEGGHFIDLVSALVAEEPATVDARATADGQDLVVTLTFPGGSLATITYTTHGNSRFPKETLDVSRGGRSGRLDNFQRVAVWSGSSRTVRRSLTGQDKGQKAMLGDFLDAVRTGGPMPIPLTSLVGTTRATLAVGDSLRTGRPEAV